MVRLSGRRLTTGCQWNMNGVFMKHEYIHEWDFGDISGISDSAPATLVEGC